MRARNGLIAIAASPVAVLLAPAPAEAHLVTTGLGPAYDGVMHFVSGPEDLFPVAALALLAGLRGPAHARRLLFALPSAWLVGGLAGAAAAVELPSGVQQIVSAGAFLVVGLLLATNPRLPSSAVAALGAIFGLFRGAIEGKSLVSGSAGLALVGAVATAFVVTALAASAALPLKRAWTTVAVRVAGSWLAALGLLLAGWWIHSSG